MTPTTCMRYVFKLCLILQVVSYCESRTFTECSLARELVKLEFFNKRDVQGAVCIAKYDGIIDSQQILLKDVNSIKRVKYYGIYQMTNKFCSEEYPEGVCNVTCELMLDDLKVATDCFLKAYDTYETTSNGTVELVPTWENHKSCQNEYFRGPDPLEKCECIVTDPNCTSRYSPISPSCKVIEDDESSSEL